MNQTRPASLLLAANRLGIPWPEKFCALVKHKDFRLSSSLTETTESALNFATASSLSKRFRRVIKSLTEMSSELDIFSAIGEISCVREMAETAGVFIRLYF